MSTTTTTELIQSTPSEESDVNIPLQNNDLPAHLQIQTYSSGDIKSPLGRFRNVVSSLSPSVLLLLD